MPPLFTALIDTYNQGRFIEEAIESVLAQDFPQNEIEIIVVDDGSTDDTAERVKRFGDRIRYIWKPNGGQASALNAGFAAAHGEIVAMLDADDLWLRHKLSRIAEEFEEHPTVQLVCHPNLYSYPDKPDCVPEGQFQPMLGDISRSGIALMQYGRFGTSGMVLRRCAGDKVFPIPETLVVYADTFVVMIAPFLLYISAINECLTKYRHHGDNQTSFAAKDHQRQMRRWTYFKKGVEESVGRLQKEGVDLQRLEVKSFLERYRLVINDFRFQFDPPGRIEFLRHNRDHNRLYGSDWGRPYAIFRDLTAVCGFILGFGTFEALRSAYAGGPLLSLRERFFPPSRGKVSRIGQVRTRTEAIS